MSVSFTIVGLEMSLDEQLRFNLGNLNAAELLRLLDLYDPGLTGSVRARDLRQRCVDLLEGGYRDLGVECGVDGRIIWCARPSGRLDGRLRDLVELCDRAGALGVIRWA